MLILSLSISCVRKNAKKKELSKSENTSFLKWNTLKFTSSIRSIFEDSKGNYWFGSTQEGVCLFNGKSFSKHKYGLSRCVVENRKGLMV